MTDTYAALDRAHWFVWETFAEVSEEYTQRDLAAEDDEYVRYAGSYD